MWAMLGVALIVAGLAVWPLVRWVHRWNDARDLDAAVAHILDGWDPDVALWDLTADESSPVCDEHLLLLATVTGVRR